MEVYPQVSPLRRNFWLKFEYNSDPVLFNVTVNQKNEGLLIFETPSCDLYLYNMREIHPHIILDIEDCHKDYEFEFIIYSNKRFIYGHGIMYENNLYSNKKSKVEATSRLEISTYKTWIDLIDNLPTCLRNQLYILN